MQDIDTSLTTNELNYKSLIKKDDILRITVTSENMELVQPFNQFIGPTNQGSLNGAGQQGQLFGYLVDNNGEIVFPLLGSIIAAGKTREEITEFLQSVLREKFVKDAVVDVRIVNFKVTVLGEVNNPGTFNLDYNRITLLQVIGQAGDLTIYGNRKNLTILRDLDGVQTSHRVDLTNSDFIDSEFYYLQQNDVVVVEPNYAQVQAAGFNRNASLYVSVASVLISLIVIISRN
ncbi:sugar transporter [Nonlabens sp. MB-3u-79]|nr:sugar transporter [Nonlabens sp. MB-3u-79]